jgi:polysaccharide pyruvyl transferase WcaK-like protein
MQILCAGFYGHGNVGDESIAQALDFYLCKPFKNVNLSFSTELTPSETQQITKDNPFYQEHKLVSVFDLETIKDPDIVIVGGGDLSAVYGLQQTLMAREAGRAKLIARIGTSANNKFLKGGEKAVGLVKSALELFDFISVRDRTSFDVLAGIGLKTHIGADLAINTIPDTNIPLPQKPYVVVTVREVRKGDVGKQTIIAKKVIDSMKREVEHVFLLPFCAADLRFAHSALDKYKNVSILGGKLLSAGQINWVIANADFVASVGRLHPLVFALSHRIPSFAVTYPWIDGYDKIHGLMSHIGLETKVADYALHEDHIGAIAHDAIYHREHFKEHINVYSSHLKGLMLESLCPVWEAMGVGYGLGLERGLGAGEFQVDDYDSTYFFGSRVFKTEREFKVYHPTRGDWEGWDVIKDLVISTMNPITLVDAGCGRGWFLKRMIEADVRAEGLDASKVAWEESAPGVKEHIKYGSFKDLAHRRYEVVTAFDVMEHIFEEDVDEAIKNLKSAAARYIVMNICAAPDNELPYTIEKGKPIPVHLEWLAVSGHVTIRHRSWWKAKLEDEDWEVDEPLVDSWFQEERFNFPSWQRHNLVILKRKEAV